MRFFARFLITVLAILLVSRYIPGIEVDGFYTALIVAVVWGLLNITLKPLLVLLTLPLTILTLGLFIFVLNALIFWFVATFIEGFEVSGFLPALVGTVLISLVHFIGDRLLSKRDE